MEVLADPQAALAVGVHAAAHILRDPLPGSGVGEEERVGFDVLGCGLEPAVGPVDEEVPAAERLDGEADPGPPARDVDDRAVEALRERGDRGGRGSSGERGVFAGGFAHVGPESVSRYPCRRLPERRGSARRKRASRLRRECG